MKYLLFLLLIGCTPAKKIGIYKSDMPAGAVTYGGHWFDMSKSTGGQIILHRDDCPCGGQLSLSGRMEVTTSRPHVIGSGNALGRSYLIVIDTMP